MENKIDITKQIKAIKARAANFSLHNTAQSNVKVLREAKMIIEEKSLDSVGCLKYCQTPHYGHPLNTDTSLLRTVCFFPGDSKLSP